MSQQRSENSTTSVRTLYQDRCWNCEQRLNDMSLIVALGHMTTSYTQFVLYHQECYVHACGGSLQLCPKEHLVDANSNTRIRLVDTYTMFRCTFGDLRTNQDFHRLDSVRCCRECAYLRLGKIILGEIDVVRNFKK